MASIPKSPFTTRSRPATPWQIRLGAADGTAPTASSVTTKLKYPVLERNPGGPLDSIEMTYDLAGQNERVVDLELKEGFARQIEIVQPAENKGDPSILVQWGELISEKRIVEEKGERIIVTAAVMPYHFGSPAQGPRYRKPTDPFAIVTHQGDIVFNPVRDGVVEFNRSSKRNAAEPDDKYWVWIDPDSTRTAAALQYAQDSATKNEWLLYQTIQALCWICNPDETYIKNPDTADLLSLLENAPKVRNVTLKPGKYLNQYLDDLLAAHGFGWRLDYSYTAEGAREIRIRLFALNNGPLVELLQQRPGDTTGARLDKSNVWHFDIDTEIAATANEIFCYGGNPEYEVTIELYRGWAETHDSKTAAELTISDGSSYAANQAVWRLWVGNEGGDYCNLRTTVAPIPSTPLALGGVLGTDITPRRRKAEDCLTYYRDDATNGARRRRPPFVQWYNASNEWAPIPDGWGEVVLLDQIGICFMADSPPADLIARGANARIRMTCTLAADSPLISTASRQTTSPNLRTNKLLVDVSDRFVKREVNSFGDFVSVLYSEPAADTKDDQTAMDTFAEKLRSTEDVAVMRGTVGLFGIHLQYKLGDCVKNIKGRDISLNRLAKTVETKKYLQIVGLGWDHQAQKTMITMQPVQEVVTAYPS